MTSSNTSTARRLMVQLDDTGKQRAFDGKGEDSTGATFKPAASGSRDTRAGATGDRRVHSAPRWKLRGDGCGIQTARHCKREGRGQEARITFPPPGRRSPHPRSRIRPPRRPFAPARSLCPAARRQARADHPLGPRRRLGHGGPSRPHGRAAHRLRVRGGQHRLSPQPAGEVPRADRRLQGGGALAAAHAKAYNLDGAHIGAWGASAGGHLVALLGTSGT